MRRRAAAAATAAARLLDFHSFPDDAARFSLARLRRIIVPPPFVRSFKLNVLA